MTDGAFGSRPFGTGPFGPKATGYTLTAEYGAFALTGQAATFAVDFVAAQASYVLTGQAAVLTPTVVASQASFALTGQAASFAVDFVCAQASYALTGTAAALTDARAVSYGSYMLTGEDVTLLHSAFICDTAALQVPINCILAGQQLFRDRYRSNEITIRRLEQKTQARRSGVDRLKGGRPSFTTRTDSKGYG